MTPKAGLRPASQLHIDIPQEIFMERQRTKTFGPRPTSGFKRVDLIARGRLPKKDKVADAIAAANKFFSDVKTSARKHSGEEAK